MDRHQHWEGIWSSRILSNGAGARDTKLLQGGSVRQERIRREELGTLDEKPFCVLQRSISHPFVLHCHGEDETKDAYVLLGVGSRWGWRGEGGFECCRRSWMSSRNWQSGGCLVDPSCKLEPSSELRLTDLSLGSATRTPTTVLTIDGQLEMIVSLHIHEGGLAAACETRKGSPLGSLLTIGQLAPFGNSGGCLDSQKKIGRWGCNTQGDFKDLGNFIHKGCLGSRGCNDRIVRAWKTSVLDFPSAC